MKLGDITREIETKLAEQNSILDAADTESEGELNEQQVGDVKKLGEEIRTLEQRAERVQEAEQLRAQVNGKQQAYRGAARPMQHGGDQDPQAVDQKTGLALATRRMSLGHEFTSDEGYKAWMQSIAPKGHMTQNVIFQSPRVEAKELITALDDTSAGALIETDRRPGLILLGQRPLVMRDIVTVGSTTSDLIEYARMVAENSRAAAVPEANNSYDDNALKPESDFEIEKVQAPVKTIAHMVTTTTRAIEDAGQLRTMIDNFLRDGLLQALEDEMVTGDGTGEHFEGLEAIDGIQDQAFVTDGIITARKARTKVRTVGRATATAYLFHPNDWEDFDLMRELAADHGQFYFGGPMVMGNPRLWGLPVVESEAVPEGTGYVGDFRTLVLWDRLQAAISMTNSHKDYFQRNLVAILGELRAAFGALRPSAIVRMDLTAGT